MKVSSCQSSCRGFLTPAIGRNCRTTSPWMRDEKQVAELYDLDDNQLAWRRRKISQLGSAQYFLRNTRQRAGSFRIE